MEPHKVAEKYVGQTEKPGNSGFNDADFERKMEQVGWQKGQAWCSYFAELVCKESYPELFDELNKLFSASAVTTFRNFSNADYHITKFPVVGTVVVWQRFKNGKADWAGHVGICSEVISPRQFISIEGNTNDKGGREGYIVAAKLRPVALNVYDGLRLLGFIDIKPKNR